MIVDATFSNSINPETRHRTRRRGTPKSHTKHARAWCVWSARVAAHRLARMGSMLARFIARSFVAGSCSQPRPPTACAATRQTLAHATHSTVEAGIVESVRVSRAILWLLATGGAGRGRSVCTPEKKSKLRPSPKTVFLVCYLATWKCTSRCSGPSHGRSQLTWNAAVGAPLLTAGLPAAALKAESRTRTRPRHGGRHRAAA